jgi:hypothetical protein
MRHCQAVTKNRPLFKPQAAGGLIISIEINAGSRTHFVIPGLHACNPGITQKCYSAHKNKKTLYKYCESDFNSLGWRRGKLESNAMAWIDSHRFNAEIKSAITTMNNPAVTKLKGILYASKPTSLFLRLPHRIIQQPAELAAFYGA